jgi:hypothetical protein
LTEVTPGVDVEHGGAGGDLFQRVLDHGVEIALHHFGGELLAAGRVDAFADDAEGLVEADDHFPGGGGDDGAGHVRSLHVSDIKNCLCGYTILVAGDASLRRLFGSCLRRWPHRPFHVGTCLGSSRISSIRAATNSSTDVVPWSRAAGP